MAARLPFSAALPYPKSKFVINGTSIVTDDHSFLVSFLQDTRKVDLPPQQIHALITFLLHTAEESCYRYVGLGSLEAEFFDDIDLAQWVRYIDRVEQRGVFDPPWPTDAHVEEIRHTALKRWTYDTSLVLRVVGIVARCGDEDGITKIEDVLFALYVGRLDWNVLNTEGKDLTSIQRLNSEVDHYFLPRCLDTVHRVLIRTQHILEASIFFFWQKERPEVLADRGWLVPAHVELQRWSDWEKAVHWDFPDIFPEEPCPGRTSATEMKRLVDSSRQLRNAAAHRKHRGAIDLPLDKLLTEARDLAEALGDIKGAKAIAVIIADAIIRFEKIIRQQHREAAEHEEAKRKLEETKEETVNSRDSSCVVGEVSEDFRSLTNVDEDVYEGLLALQARDEE